MLHLVLRHLNEKASGSHADHDNFLFIRKVITAGSRGDEFIHLAGRAAVYCLLHVFASYAGDIHSFHIGKLQIILIQISSESTIKGSHLAVCLDCHGRKHMLSFKSYDFGSTAADINSYLDGHDSPPPTFRLLSQKHLTKYLIHGILHRADTDDPDFTSFFTFFQRHIGNYTFLEAQLLRLCHALFRHADRTDLTA